VPGMSARQAQQMADRVLGAWGRPARPPRPVAVRENAVFDAALQDGRRLALRLHRPGYQDARAIRAELDWIAALARAGFPVPMPVPTITGGWLAETGDRLASCTTWMNGAPLGEGGTPLGPAGPAQMQAVGALLAGLHDATDALALPANLPRHAWNAEGLLGENALWGRFWETPATDAAGRALLRAARDAAAARLTDLAASGADYGLIHADALRENILVLPDGLALIDFDDAGWGFRMYDLGTAMVQGLAEPGAADLAAALLTGYGAHRALPGDAHDLVLFTALRAFASAGWILTRTAPDDRRRVSHTRRALHMARHVVEGTTPWA